ncbi:ArsR family transcriptional regulator [Acetomicrobium sp.]|uniref:ArsR family transcriptional regulator n=1 Tax=Acetomicrobium sp. TaxID=1872099 RepID=UPI002872AAA8|nr:ArsR family transcriptional regulator [Acetomicrobium sp.]MDR9768830.1 ArsR family transcriptional regulator [Acetomicrobium sp.]
MAEKISPQEARQEVQSGKALLVCAYEDEERYKKVRLEGAISLKEFRNKEQDLIKRSRDHILLRLT